MKKLLLSLLTFTLFPAFISSSCRRDPSPANFEHSGGFVIGKETCKSNADEDYWLIDLSLIYPEYGDTITINGRFYEHVVKTTQLIPEFKTIGKAVSFDFHLSATRVTSAGCTATNPVTYNLKEMTVIASGEIR